MTHGHRGDRYPREALELPKKKRKNKRHVAGNKPGNNFPRCTTFRSRLTKSNDRTGFFDSFPVGYLFFVRRSLRVENQRHLRFFRIFWEISRVKK